ncbi:Uncharacterized protein Rs2_51018 [Raphanus sativus]|nr:Uncharacterized protein Rs2_51018 [Raphanus sativus]
MMTFLCNNLVNETIIVVQFVITYSLRSGRSSAAPPVFLSTAPPVFFSAAPLCSSPKLRRVPLQLRPCSSLQLCLCSSPQLRRVPLRSSAVFLSSSARVSICS